MINASKLDRKDFINSFYYLLINGIIEKEFWKKDNNDDVCFRIPIEERKNYIPPRRYVRQKTRLF